MNTNNEMTIVALNIIKCVKRNKWNAYIVGGFARDYVLGIQSKDVDIEVYGPDSVAALEKFLCSKYDNVKFVGKSFGVFKVRIGEFDFDISLPRTESKSGHGHKEFDVVPDGSISPKLAASRRDFTFNALMLNADMNIIDYFGGIADLKAKRLRHTSTAFGDDPLRVVRGMQFAGRFDLTAEKETVDISRGLLKEFYTLPKDRLWIEFEKVMMRKLKMLMRQ